MSRTNSFDDSTFREIRDKYRALKAPYKKALEELEHAREIKWQQSARHMLLKYPSGLPRAPIGHVAFLALLFLVNEWYFGLKLLLFTVAICLVGSLARWMEEHSKAAYLSNSIHGLEPLVFAAEEAKARLTKIETMYKFEWASACESYSGYPPDWNERREAVKQRDKYACQKCSYPKGFVRKSRELHVHHVIAISDGGNNHLSNLITLCHICHRNVDSTHSGVRKLHSRKRRK